MATLTKKKLPTITTTCINIYTSTNFKNDVIYTEVKDSLSS